MAATAKIPYSADRLAVARTVPPVTGTALISIETTNARDLDRLWTGVGQRKLSTILKDVTFSTNRGEIVLDPFLGSGSTLIAAENTGRVCCGIELDPLYVDVIIQRYEAETGVAAVLADTGETFEKVAAHRRNDASRT